MFKKKLIVLLVFTCSIHHSFSQSGKICNWKDDKKAAVVLTFDDWTPGHFNIVYPELQARNINATFFVTTNSVNNWSELNTVFSAGNEVGNHTKSHSDLTKLTAIQIGNEIRGAKKVLDQNVSSRITNTFAYPYGTFNSAIIDSIKKSKHIGARGVWPISDYTYNFATTIDDYFNTRMFGMDKDVSTAQFLAPISSVISGGGMLTYLYHVVANASYPDNTAIQQAQLKEQLDALVAVQDKIWITTYENALKYHREKRCATLSEIQAPDGVQRIVNLTDTLSNNNVYNHPLTLKLKMNSINYDKILQNGNPIPIDAIKNDTIIFRAVPDAGHIVLKVSTGISITSPMVTPSIVSNNSSNTLLFQVTATDDGSVSKVEIDLSPIGGSSSVIMTTNTSNQYNTSFTVPQGLALGVRNLIVTATDNLGNKNTVPIAVTINSGTIFTNTKITPSSIVNNIANMVHFSTMASDDGLINSVVLDLSSIGGGTSVLMNNDGNSNYSKDFGVPAGISIGLKNIPITVTDNMGNITSTTIPFTVEPYLTYLNIYTDNDAMVCSSCVWAENGTIVEQSNAGAMEAVKDYFFQYAISGWWAGIGLNVSSWTAANAKDFSTYDSLQFSYLGPVGTGVVSLSLADANNGHSDAISFPASSIYTTVSVPLASITAVDLKKITELNFSMGGVESGSGSIRVDNIRLVKQNKSVLGLEDFTSKNQPGQLKVFPNPNNGTFNLFISENTKDVDKIIIFDTLGKIVYSSNYTTEINQNRTKYPISIDVSSGVYFVKLITSKGEAIVQKVIIN